MYGMINTLLCIYIVIILYCGAIPISLVQPSFESTWYEITAQDPVNSNVTIPHNLGVYPVKVDVQVKVMIKGKDYIFTGIGSAHRDDDYDEDYGATVYIYNDVAIVVTVPVKNNNFGRGGIAYTGSSDLYVGPTELKGPYYHGFVKVRAWVANDMPSVVINMTTYMDNGTNSFKELNHSLGTYPDIVSVQIRLQTGYISDAQGVVLNSRNGTHSGGVVFGYDDQKIQLWAPRGYGNQKRSWKFSEFKNNQEPFATAASISNIFWNRTLSDLDFRTIWTFSVSFSYCITENILTCNLTGYRLKF